MLGTGLGKHVIALTMVGSGCWWQLSLNLRQHSNVLPREALWCKVKPDQHLHVASSSWYSVLLAPEPGLSSALLLSVQEAAWVAFCFLVNLILASPLILHVLRRGPSFSLDGRGGRRLEGFESQPPATVCWGALLVGVRNHLTNRKLEFLGTWALTCSWQLMTLYESGVPHHTRLILGEQPPLA